MSSPLQFRFDHKDFKVLKPHHKKHNIVLVFERQFAKSKSDTKRVSMPGHAWIFFKEMCRDLGFVNFPKRWQINEEYYDRGICMMCTDRWDDKLKLFGTLSTHAHNSPRSVYMLFGHPAHQYKALLARKKHMVILLPNLYTPTKTTNHRFTNSAPFSKACKFLNIPKDIWRVS